MKKYYLPPIGFGLFYQLGALENVINNENYELYGSSGGAIVCLLSILKKEDRDIFFLMNITKKIRQKFYFNFYPYLNHFIKEVFIILDSYDNTYIEQKLKTIYIEVTEICHIFHLKRRFIQPQNLIELKDLVISSCYLPFVFWHRNPFYYQVKDKKYFDGFFGNFSNITNDFIKIDSYQFATIVPSTESKFVSDYQKGKMYNFQEKNKKFTLLSFVQISLKILYDVCLYIPNNLSQKKKIAYIENAKLYS